MESEKEAIKTKSTGYYEYKNNLYSKINKIFSLQSFNLFFICILIYYIKDNKNLFSNKQKEQKVNNIAEKIKFLQLLTNNDELEYRGLRECLLTDPDKNFCIYHLILPKEVIGKKRILLGEKYDGCYVLLDDFINIKIAYSFGISRNIQFDKALADKGIDIYMYDHTINSLPYENPKFHWKKIGLCGMRTKNPNLKNLEQLIAENGHSKEKNMILKMDIEHWEFESLIDLKEETLNQFKYIAIEYHFKDQTKFKSNNLYYNVLKKIAKTHQAFYARCNGDRGYIAQFGFNRICHIIEVSYIIKKGNIFRKDEAIYPLYEFDYSVPQKGKLEMNLNILKLFDE